MVQNHNKIKEKIQKYFFNVKITTLKQLILNLISAFKDIIFAFTSILKIFLLQLHYSI
jgi:hypothetical protein